MLVYNIIDDPKYNIATINGLDATVYHENWYDSQMKGEVIFTMEIGELPSNLFVGFSSFDDIVDGCFVNDTRLNYFIQHDGDLWARDDKYHDS